MTNERPRPADLVGLAPGMTGGLRSEEWVRRIRDIPDDEADAYLQAVHEADRGDGHGHAPEDCPDR